MPASIRAAAIRISPRKVSSRRLDVVSLVEDVVAATLGLTLNFIVKLVGDFPTAEFVLLCLFPILLIARGSRLIRRDLLPIVVLFGLWLLNQALTDVYRQSAPIDWIRGVANIVFLGIDCAGLLMLLAESARRQVIFILTSAFSSLIATRFFPTLYAQVEPWKFGYATGVIALVILLSCYFYRQRQYIVVTALIAGVAVVNLLLNFRSPVLSLLLTLVLTVPIIPEYVGRLRLLPRSGTGARLVVLVAMVAVTGLTAEGLVNLATQAGWLGEEAQVKNEAQRQSSVGLLLGGRPEFFIGLRAAMDSPILGHGSWAQDLRYVDMQFDWQYEYGLAHDIETAETLSGGRIPSHSHLVGAWVDGGIMGAVLWGYIFWLNGRALTRITSLTTALAPAYCVILVAFAWSILFSPLGTTGRMNDALALVILLDLLRSPNPSQPRFSPRGLRLRPVPSQRKPLIARSRSMCIVVQRIGLDDHATGTL